MNPQNPSKNVSGVPPGLLELARRGLVKLGGPNDPSAIPRMSAMMTAAEIKALLDEERGDR